MYDYTDDTWWKIKLIHVKYKKEENISTNKSKQVNCRIGVVLHSFKDKRKERKKKRAFI